jgi:outer membrane immunogenic protein
LGFRLADPAPPRPIAVHAVQSSDILSARNLRVSGWLFYARGGVAWIHEKIDDAYVSPAAGFAIDPSASVMRTGWTLGGGVERAFAPRWSANVEYNYDDFGTKGPIQLISPFEGITVAHLKDTIHAATVGVNYHY